MVTMMNNVGPTSEDMPITQPIGALSCVEPDLSFHKDSSDKTKCVVWSPDSRRHYVADSAPQLIHAYDCELASGSVSNR